MRGVKAVRARLGALRRHFRNRSDAALWRLTGKRPGLNTHSAVKHVEHALSAPPERANLKGGRLHVRIAFHYVPWRLKYLVEVVQAAQALPFDQIDIWIDTNTTQLETETCLPGDYQIAVWDALDHPFKLTWVHREEMYKRLNDFDAFMYLEDDIIIPPQTMQRWLEETPRLAKHGFLPGFIRAEEDFDGQLMLADYLHPLERKSVLHLDGRAYLPTPFCYQACWVYDAVQMKELAELPDFLTGDVSNPDMRARVALGLQFKNVPDGMPSRAVIPLTEDLQVAPDALVFHSPCNYAQLKPPHWAGLAQTPVSGILSD